MIIALLLLALADPPKGMSFVPSAQVHGRTFTAPDGWFSIDAPGDDWVWLQSERITAGSDDPRNPPAKGVSWTGHSEGWKAYFVITESQSQTDNALNDVYIRALERRFRATYQDQFGKTMSNFRVERINLPLEGSLHFTYSTTDKAGKVMYYYGYVSGRVHRVTLLAPTKSSVEPPLFRRAVVSMRWLKEP